MRIEYTHIAIKHINNLNKDTKNRVRIAVEKLPSGDVKRLQGYKDNYRLRVGDLRILFSMNNETIIIKDVLPRGQAYNRL